MRRAAGRPPHEPTSETRAAVSAAAAEGLSHREMAKRIGVSPPTLRAHYAAEITAARAEISFALPEFAEPAPPGRAREGAGRPAHEATPELRERVEILVAGGQTAWQIAAALGVSEPTLRLHYAAELDTGRARKTADVLEALYREAKDGNVSAMKAWLGRSTHLDEPPAAEEPLGKKQAAQAAARTAESNTSWEGILPN